MKSSTSARTILKAITVSRTKVAAQLTRAASAIAMRGISVSSKGAMMHPRQKQRQQQQKLKVTVAQQKRTNVTVFRSAAMKSSTSARTILKAITVSRTKVAAQ